MKKLSEYEQCKILQKHWNLFSLRGQDYRTVIRNTLDKVGLDKIMTVDKVLKNGVLSDEDTVARIIHLANLRLHSITY